MATNNGLNQRTEILIVGPIGTSANGGSLITVEKDQAATTAVSVINATNDPAAQTVVQLKQKMNASSTIATGGVVFFNDQYTSDSSLAGYIVLMNDLTNTSEPGKGVAIVGHQNTDTVFVGVGSPSVSQAKWTSSGGVYRGLNTSTAPAAGFIGERIVATVSNGSPVSLPTATTENITSVSLTAGTWDISCVAMLTGGANTGSGWFASITSSSGGAGTIGDTRVDTPTMCTASKDTVLTIPAVRVNLSATTTYYLTEQAIYSVGTLSGYGRLSAVRVA